MVTPSQIISEYYIKLRCIIIVPQTILETDVNLRLANVLFYIDRMNTKSAKLAFTSVPEHILRNFH